MALLFLANHGAAAATSLAMVLGGADPNPDFALTNVAYESRSKMFKGTATTGLTELAYTFTSDVACDHMVVARADKLLTKNQMDVAFRQRSSGGVWSDLGTAYDPLTSADLIGIRSQDLVRSVSPTSLRGYSVRAVTNGVTPEAMMLSKFYASASFSLGIEPDQESLQTEELAPGTEETPLRGTRPYEVEKKISMTFFGVTGAKVTAFRALPQIFNWPLFLYDTTGDLWSWKLEHVIVTDFTTAIVGEGRWGVELSVHRLRHDD